MVLLQLSATLRGHTGPVWCVSWSPRGLLASCGSDRTVRIWSPSGEGGSSRCRPADGAKSSPWQQVASLGEDAFSRIVRSVAWAPDGQTLAAAVFDGFPKILRLSRENAVMLKAVVELPGHMAEVKSVAFSSSGGLLATCSRDRSVMLWEVDGDLDYECIEELPGHKADVKSVAWHPHAEILISTSYDNMVRAYAEDMEGWYCVQELAEHSDTVWCSAFNKSGDRLATVSADGSLVIWDMFSPPRVKLGCPFQFKIVQRLEKAHCGPVYGVDWSSKREIIATAGGDDCIRVYAKSEDGLTINEHETAGTEDVSMEGYSCIAEMVRAHTGDVNCVAWHPNESSCLASGGDDSLVRIWQLKL